MMQPPKSTLASGSEPRVTAYQPSAPDSANQEHGVSICWTSPARVADDKRVGGAWVDVPIGACGHRLKVLNLVARLPALAAGAKATAASGPEVWLDIDQWGELTPEELAMNSEAGPKRPRVHDLPLPEPRFFLMQRIA